MSQFQTEFIPAVEQVTTAKKPFQLRDGISELCDWSSRGQYFDLLKTPVLETLSQQVREAGGSSDKLRLLSDRILLGRYLLDSRFDDFLSFTKQNDIPIPSQLSELMNHWHTVGEPYQRQIRLIETLADLECDSELFRGLKADIQGRFISHQPFVNVVTTVGTPNHSLRRDAITFVVKAEGKVRNTPDIFLSAQKIGDGFRQAIEEIQDAMQLSDDTGRYWIRLGILQELIRTADIGLDGRSAQAAIGWLTFLIENRIPFGKAYLLSVWGEYVPQFRRFRPVAGVKAKLDACKADGIRVVAVPQATLAERVESGTTFADYAKAKQISLIPFPDEMPIEEVYHLILGECRELGIIPVQQEPSERTEKTENHSPMHSNPEQVINNYAPVDTQTIIRQVDTLHIGKKG